MHAATSVWTGPSTGGSFNSASNWSAGVPDADDVALFNATSNVDGAITFSSSVTAQDMHLRNTAGTIEFDVGAGNSYAVTRNLIFGAAAGETNAAVFSSGQITSGLLLIGNNSGSANNSLTLTGAGTSWNAVGVSTTASIRLGSNGGPNSALTIANGAAMAGQTLAIIGLQSSSNNTLTVTGAGSQFSVVHSLSIGDAIAAGLPNQTNNQLKVLDQGFATIRELIVGTTAASPDNTVTVSGAGTKLNIRGGQQSPPTEMGQRMDIGRASTNNKLIINAGGEVYGGGIYHLGRETTSTGNLLSVTDGALIGGGIEIKRGKVFIQNSTVEINRKIDALIGIPLGGSLLAQFPTAEIDFRSGTLATVNATVTNGVPMIIGDGGAIPAIYRMKPDITNSTSRTHTFADGLIIQSNGRVEGAATIVGNVTNNGQMNLGVSAGTMKIDGSLTINTGGKVDVSNNPMIVTGSPLGSWNGANYSDITGEVARGRHGGSWNGSGITTSMSDAPTGLTTVAVALADDLGRVGSTFGGVTLQSGDVMVMYTYTGDADLSGFIDGDDYAAIDAGFTGSLTGYTKGDFDYSGHIDADDYWLIDRNYSRQTTAFPSSSPVSVSAVPEPASLSILGLTAASLMCRRRRN